MIGKLSGIVDSLYEDFLILDVNGVGYIVFCSTRTLSVIPQVGNRVSLWIETQVREDAIRLYGFADMAEKENFILLTSVQGVGSKVGLAILSALSLQEISLALATGDAKAFTKACGVGLKLATRIVSELKDKQSVLSSQALPTGFSCPSQISTQAQDAISALVNLGYSKSEASQFVYTICADKPEATTADLIRLSLREIGKKNG